MEKIRALIIDNDILVRRVFFNVLNSFDALDVRALSDREEISIVLQEEKVDVIFINIDNSDTSKNIDFKKLKTLYPSLKIVVTAPRSEKGAKETIEALKNGAIDFVTKPESNNSILFANNPFRKRLELIVNNIHHLKFGEENFRFITKSRKNLGAKKANIVVIGCGSEGVKDLYKVFKYLPENLDAPILIVPHLPKFYTKKLAESLNKASYLDTMEVTNGMYIKSGSAYIIPGGFHGELVPQNNGCYIRLHRGQRVNEVRPSIDLTFRSAAKYFSEATLGVFLSGYGHDGFAGARAIKERGGEVIVQDPRSLFAGKLSHDIIKAGYYDKICSVESISWEIIKRARLRKENINLVSPSAKSDILLQS